jgi:hypothetical protein
MENRSREPFLARLLIAFLITGFVFGIIFFVSYQISYANSRAIKSSNSLIDQSLFQMDTLLRSNYSCNDSLLVSSSSLLDENGKMISILETRLGFDDPVVMQEKGVYSSLEWDHYELIKTFDEKCSKNFYPFLFIYSNKNHKSESENAGSILSAFKQEHPDSVYSFDADLNYPILNSLKKDYPLNSFPVIITPRNETLYLTNINQLEFLINNTRQ